MPLKLKLDKVIYDFINPAGHPIHLKHIISGRWSKMDKETLQYHYNKNKAHLKPTQIDLINQILLHQNCSSNEEINAMQSLLKLVDRNNVYIANNYYMRFLYIIFIVPLIAGVISLIILIFGNELDGKYNVSKSSTLLRNIIELSDTLDKSNNKLIELESKLSNLNNFYLNRHSTISDTMRSELVKLIDAEITNFLDESHIKGDLKNDNIGKYNKLLNVLSNRISKLETSSKLIDSIINNLNQIDLKLKNVESIVSNNPENIINIRMLQRDVEELSNKMKQKVETDVLKEKELRLSESISKEVGGLSREVEILRWVIYLLVIGLTASGGLIVAMQRRKQ